MNIVTGINDFHVDCRRPLLGNSDVLSDSCRIASKLIDEDILVRIVIVQERFCEPSVVDFLLKGLSQLMSSVYEAEIGRQRHGHGIVIYWGASLRSCTEGSHNLDWPRLELKRKLVFESSWQPRVVIEEAVDH